MKSNKLFLITPTILSLFPMSKFLNKKLFNDKLCDPKV